MLAHPGADANAVVAPSVGVATLFAFNPSVHGDQEAGPPCRRGPGTWCSSPPRENGDPAAIAATAGDFVRAIPLTA